jgi:hypothetical protein
VILELAHRRAVALSVRRARESAVKVVAGDDAAEEVFLAMHAA